jgi:1-acyl-sn-glycerol-3-phosphate acyltransferase
VSDWFYNFIYYTWRPAFIVSSSPVVLHIDRARRQGAYILASNHLSPFDVAVLIKETPRLLDFVSVTEVFRNPLVAWFYGNMNAFPLDRGRVDTGTTRIILERLRRGRVVALFPEGRIRPESESIVHGGPFKPGVLRLARIANVPIIPVVVLGTIGYHRMSNWLPLRRTRYGINYGNPIEPDPTDETGKLEEALRLAYRSLYEELSQAMSPNL